MNLKPAITVGLVSQSTAINPKLRKFVKRAIDDAAKAERTRLSRQVTSAQNFQRRLHAGTPDDLLRAARGWVNKAAPHLTGARYEMAIGEALRDPDFQNEFKGLMR